MAFYWSKTIQSVRKARPCNGCCVQIEAGMSALACTGITDVGFWSGTYHHDCRSAENLLNKSAHSYQSGEWTVLHDVIDWEDWPWLIKIYPAVAERMQITFERYAQTKAEWRMSLARLCGDTPGLASSSAVLENRIR